MVAKRSNRITLGTFDFIKGAAMVFVVVFHTIGGYDYTKSPVLNGIFEFTQDFSGGVIPLFFIISGFGFKPKKWDIMLKKSFKDYIIPFFWVILAYAFLHPIAHYPFSKSWEFVTRDANGFVLSLLLGNTGRVTLFGMTLPWWLPIWYLMASFIALNLLNLIVKMDKIVLQFVCVFLCYITGCGLYWVKFGFYCLPQGFLAVGFVYLGYMIKKYNLVDKLLNNVYTYIVLIPIAVLEIKWGTFDLCAALFENIVLDYIGVTCEALLFMLMGVYIGRLDWKCLEWVKQIGVYTLWIICIHTFEQNGLHWYILRDPNHQLAGFCIELFLKCILFTVVCACLKKITQYRYMKRMMKNAK